MSHPRECCLKYSLVELALRIFPISFTVTIRNSPFFRDAVFISPGPDRAPSASGFASRAAKGWSWSFTFLPGLRFTEGRRETKEGAGDIAGAAAPRTRTRRGCDRWVKVDWSGTKRTRQQHHYASSHSHDLAIPKTHQKPSETPPKNTIGTEPLKRFSEVSQ